MTDSLKRKWQSIVEMINRLEIAENYFKIPIETICNNVKKIVNNK